MKIKLINEEKLEEKKSFRITHYRHNPKDEYLVTERDELKLLLEESEEIKKFINSSKLRSKRKLKIKILNFLKSRQTKYYASICLIIRNENEYLQEWLEWHRNIGIEHFYIYDHMSGVPVKEFIKSLNDDLRQMITVIDFEYGSHFAQINAYNECLKKYGKDSYWMGFIDSDEFVRLNKLTNIKTFLNRYTTAGAVMLAWTEYDANGFEKKTKGLVRERFTHKSNYMGFSTLGKVFVQPLLVRKMFIHNCILREAFYTIDEKHEKVVSESCCVTNRTVKEATIDHYYTKSHEEWVEKMNRGSCDPVYSRKYEHFFDYNSDLIHCKLKSEPIQIYEKKVNKK